MGSSTSTAPGASTPRKPAGKGKAVGKQPTVTKNSSTRKTPTGTTSTASTGPTPTGEPTTEGPTGGATTSGGSGAGRDAPGTPAPEPPAPDDTPRNSPPPPTPAPGKKFPEFASDEDIVRGWSELEKIVARFAETAFVDHLPAEALAPGRYPYATLRKLSGEPSLMCRSPRYAKYVFQSAVWNILDKWFFTGSTAWACEGGDAAWDEQSPTRGLIAAIGKLTCECSEPGTRTAT